MPGFSREDALATLQQKVFEGLIAKGRVRWRDDLEPTVDHVLEVLSQGDTLVELLTCGPSERASLREKVAAAIAGRHPELEAASVALLALDVLEAVTWPSVFWALDVLARRTREARP
jgi:hypothetical protein